MLFSHAVADRAGISSTDLETLDILARNGPMTAGRLAELTGSPPALSPVSLTAWSATATPAASPTPPIAAPSSSGPSSRTRSVTSPRRTTAMAQAMAELMSRYSDEDLTVIADFMTRAAAVTG